MKRFWTWWPFWAVVATLVVIAGVGVSLNVGIGIGHREGGCYALTGSSTCDFTKMTQCQEHGPRSPLPCAWVAGTHDNDLGVTFVFWHGPCPPLGDDVTCIDVTGPDYDE